MSVGVQDIVVGVLVGGCALFSIWRLASVRVRLRLLEALRRLPAFGEAAWLARLRTRTLARSLAACGGCSPPGATEKRQSGARPGATTPGEASPNRTPGALRR